MTGRRKDGVTNGSNLIGVFLTTSLGPIMGEKYGVSKLKKMVKNNLGPSLGCSAQCLLGKSGCHDVVMVSSHLQNTDRDRLTNSQINKQPD